MDFAAWRDRAQRFGPFLLLAGLAALGLAAWKYNWIEHLSDVDVLAEDLRRDDLLLRRDPDLAAISTDPEAVIDTLTILWTRGFEQ